MALYFAAGAGDLKRVKMLVEGGGDKNKTGAAGQTLLFVASDNDHLEVVRYLVEQGADMEKANNDGDTPLLRACHVVQCRKYFDIIQYLVEQGADKEKADRFGFTPLLHASFQGRLDLVRYLLEQGANRDKASNDGMTALHHAAQYGHLEIAKLLMVYGADLNARNNDGELPIDMGFRNTEEIKKAIRDEPRRRMDHGHKRATEQDRHPNSASAQQEDGEEEVEMDNKRPRLDEGAVAEEDEDSEPSDGEDDGWSLSYRLQLAHANSVDK